MSERIATAVFAALGRQLGQPAEAVQARANEGLDVLGLDSHGLMRVLLDIEQALGVSDLQLADDALATPASMVFGVVAAAG